MKTNYKPISHAVFIVSTLLCFSIQAQSTFEKIYPSGQMNKSGTDVLPAIDGGYIITASTETSIHNDLDIEIIKTDDQGNVQWTKTYGGSKPDYPNNILITSDGNYFVIGYTQSFGGGDYNIYLLKLDPSGNLIFSKVYGGYGNEEGKEIIATADGNYIIVGGSNSVDYSNRDMLLIKIDPSGNTLWTKYYGTGQYESARSAKLCSDGGFIVAGRTMDTVTNISSVYLVRINKDGGVLWSNTFSGGSHSYEGKYVLANSDGSYTIAVDDSSDTRDSDVRVMQVDASGNNILWNYMFGGAQKDIVKTIRPTSDGGYIVGSISRSFGWIDPDMWLIKLKPNGDSAWSQHYGGPDHEHCLGVRQTADGDYIAIGHSKTYNINRFTEIMFIKVGPSGEIASVDELAMNPDAIRAYPNPSDGFVKIDFNSGTDQARLNVFNELGQSVYAETYSGYTGARTIDLSGHNPGIYFVSIQSGKGLASRKLILK